MQKALVEKFISKYNLGGVAEAVIIVLDDNTAKTKFVSDDSSVAGFISAENFELEDGSYGIYDTSQLKSLLGVLGENITISPISSNSRTTGLKFKDDKNQVTYVLADPTNIPTAPDLKTLPKFEIEINVDRDFSNSFIRGQQALPNNETFTVLSDGTDTSVVLGHSSINTNRITLSPKVTSASSISPISFSSRYLSAILSANKEATSGTFKVSSAGLAHLNFVVDGFVIDYYLVKIQTQD